MSTLKRPGFDEAGGSDGLKRSRTAEEEPPNLAQQDPPAAGVSAAPPAVQPLSKEQIEPTQPDDAEEPVKTEDSAVDLRTTSSPPDAGASEASQPLTQPEQAPTRPALPPAVQPVVQPVVQPPVQPPVQPAVKSKVNKPEPTEESVLGLTASLADIDMVVCHLALPDPNVRVAVQYANSRTADQSVQAYAKLAGRTWTYYVRSLKLVIGRSTADAGSRGIDIDLAPSKVVSRTHATIQYDMDLRQWRLEVSGRNGARLDNEFVKTGPKRLRSGSIIEVGGVQMMFALPDQQPQVAANMVKASWVTDSRWAEIPPHLLQIQLRQLQANAAGQPAQATARAAANLVTRPQVQSDDQFDQDLSGDDCKDIKPPFSYATMISQAILSSPEHMMSLADIYAWISSSYAFYRFSRPGWQNSIRHNLSLNKAFEKVPRPQNEPGKGSKWQIVAAYKDELVKKAHLGRHFKHRAASGSQRRPVGDDGRLQRPAPQASQPAQPAQRLQPPAVALNPQQQQQQQQIQQQQIQQQQMMMYQMAMGMMPNMQDSSNGYQVPFMVPQFPVQWPNQMVPNPQGKSPAKQTRLNEGANLEQSTPMRPPNFPSLGPPSAVKLPESSPATWSKYVELSSTPDHPSKANLHGTTETPVRTREPVGPVGPREPVRGPEAAAEASAVREAVEASPVREAVEVPAVRESVEGPAVRESVEGPAVREAVEAPAMSVGGPVMPAVAPVGGSEAIREPMEAAKGPEEAVNASNGPEEAMKDPAMETTVPEAATESRFPETTTASGAIEEPSAPADSQASAAGPSGGTA